MNDKQVIWVFGDSAAGKETFIRAVTGDRPPHIVNELGWSQLSVAASDASLRWIGQIDDDPITKKRNGIFGEVGALIPHNDIVLLKGQIVDLEADRPQRLKQAVSNAAHSIIYLEAGLDVPFDRLPHKTWTTGQETLADLQLWRDKQFRLLNALSGFGVIALDSRNGADYQQIPLPPELSGFNEKAGGYQGNDIYCDVIIPKKVSLEIVTETNNVLAYKHTKPHWETHIVVTPKSHIASFLELSKQPVELQQELLEVLEQVAQTVKDKQGACRVLTNLGEYQDSKHLHFHIYHD